MKWIESWLTTYFFWRLYKKFSGNGWALVCKTPLLNIAFPDDSVQYFVCSFPREAYVCLVGSPPPRDLVAYSALTVYDTHGLPVSSLYDNQWAHYKNGIVMGRDLALPPSSYYCLILRLYMTSPRPKSPLRLSPLRLSPLRLDLCPSLVTTMDDGCEQTLSDISVRTIVENSEHVQEKVVDFLSKRALPVFDGQAQQFYAPASSEMARFFVNENAAYMIAVPNPHQRVLCVTGQRYPKIGREHEVRFTGFMACNFKTTATDSSIAWENLPVHYRIWVAFSEREARLAGYTEEDALLLWKPSNGWPIVVYREVRVDHKGLLRRATDRKVEASECRKLMGRFYPRVCYKEQ